MLVYILSTFFSALSYVLGIYWLKNGLFPGYTQSDLWMVLLHCDIINFFLFFTLYGILKARGKIHFSLRKTFTDKDEIKQILLFSITMLAICYKSIILGSVKMSHFSVTSMIKPIVAWLLAIVFLKEKFDKRAIKFAALAIIGFCIINFHKIGIETNEIFYLGSYVLIAGVGNITRRYYCRKRSEDMQALFLESFIFTLYGVVILLFCRCFSLQLLFNPYSFCVASLMFTNHFCSVYGVRKAHNIVSIEFANFSKTIFELLLSFLLLGEYLNKAQIIGGIFIVLAVLGMNSLERQAKKNG